MAIAKGTSSRRQPPSGQPYFAPGTTLNLNTPAAKARGEAWRQSRQPGQAQPIAPPSRGTTYTPQHIQDAIKRSKEQYAAKLKAQNAPPAQAQGPAPQPSTTANNENGAPQEPPGGWDWRGHIDAERRIYPPQFGYDQPQPMPGGNPWSDPGFIGTHMVGEYGDPQPRPGVGGQQPGWGGGGSVAVGGTDAVGEAGEGGLLRPGVGGQQPGWGGGWGGGSGGQQPSFNFNPNPVQAALNNSMGLFGSPFTQSVSGPFGNTQTDMWNNMGGFVQAVNNQSGQKPVGTFDGPIQNQNTYDIRSLINQGNQMVQDGWQNPFMQGGGQTAQPPAYDTTQALYETDPGYGPPRQSGGQAGGGWQMPAGGIDFTDPETGFRVRSPGDFPTRRAPPAGMDAKWV